EIFSDELWGTVMVIDHGNGVTAKYCGLSSELSLKKGDSVQKYQIIGRLGRIPIESADGTHLHFEMTVNGETVDPLEALNKN
ncbi:MAG: M23 family metallopeptidase, partial [Clostridiales bacterium]|nr:M23 family metallopeptidase [Clostridiales bacterium]